MWVLVAYDVSTAEEGGRKRLRRVARACMDYGQRVQKSVFECTLGEAEWALLLTRLLKEMDKKHDSIRVYYLDAGVKVEHFGEHEPPDLEGPLIL